MIDELPKDIEDEMDDMRTEIHRLRAVVAMAGTRADQGDKDFCMWCGRENREEHTYDCRAFMPNGDPR